MTIANPRALSEWPLYITLTLAACILIFYLWASLFIYWLTRIRKGRQSAFAAVRLRDVIGFFDELPPPDWQGWSCFLTASLATLVIILGCLLAYPATMGLLVENRLIQGERVEGLAHILQQTTRPLFFGFLGAYLFTIQSTLRRYLDSDLTPDAYVVVTTRMIIALIVSGTMAVALPLNSEAQRVFGANLQTASYAVAFVVGVFPEKGLSWLFSFAGRVLKRFDSEDNNQTSMPLRSLSGLTNWHALRFNVEGIDNVHNLANADVNQLIRRTRFTVQQIFDWVDQAILAIHLNDVQAFANLQKHGIRGFSDFQMVYQNDETRQALAQWLSPQGNVKDGEQRANVLYAAMREAPNVDPVRLYWRFKDSYVTGVFEFFNRAVVLEELERFEEAVDKYSEALKRNMYEPMLYISRGSALEQRARQLMINGETKEAENLLGQAINDFTQAIKLDPFIADAYYKRGELYLRTGRHREATEDFSKVLGISKGNVRALNNRAIAIQKLAEQYPKAEADAAHKKALGDLRRALKIDRQSAPTYVNLANIYILQKNYREAERHVKEALDLDSTYADAYYCRGRYYFHRNLFNSAVRDFQMAIDLKIAEPEQVYVALGRVHLKNWEQQNDPDEFDLAMAALKLATKHNRSYIFAYMERANAYRMNHQPSEAIADYTTIIEDLKVEQPEVYVNRGLAYMEAGDELNALEDLNKGINLDDKRAVAYINRGIIHEHQGNLLQSLADFTKAIELQNEARQPTAQAYNNRGIVKGKLGLYDEAIEDFEEALRLDSRYAEAYNNLGEMYLRLTQFATAEKLFTDALQLSPDSIHFYNRGLVRLTTNRFEDAILDFTEALKRDPNNVITLKARAKALSSAGYHDEALRDIEEVLSVNPKDEDAAEERKRLEPRVAPRAPAHVPLVPERVS